MIKRTITLRARTWQRRAIVTLSLACAVGGVITAGINAGYRLNVTPSEPLGLWKGIEVNHYQTGDVVEACVPQSSIMTLALARGYLLPGPCPGGWATVIKPIAAQAGDVVGITASGVTINGHAISTVGPVNKDSAGRPLSSVVSGTVTVPSGMVFLLSDYTAKSFDSRYFGFVPATSLRHKMIPIAVTGWKPKGY